jgi:flagellar basal-body rod protein FlgF/flagellar basal-body rod protein FlgG
MIRGMYAAASGLVAATEQQEVTAHNLSHSSTPGYRERGIVFETFDRVLGRTLEPTGDLTGTRTARTYHDFRPGAFQFTENPYDLALSEPDRFFVLIGPNGPIYTRNGSFRPTAAGPIVSQAGYPLQGTDGSVTVPPTALRVNIASDGSVTADGEPVGQIRTVRFADPQQLVSVGPTLFRAPPDAGIADVPSRVLQGYREGSNAQPADAMVRMLLGTRYYEAAQRALRTMAESLQLNTRPQGA